MDKQIITIKLDLKLFEKLNELKVGDTLTTEWLFTNQYGEAITVQFIKE